MHDHSWASIRPKPDPLSPKKTWFQNLIFCTLYLLIIVFSGWFLLNLWISPINKLLGLPLVEDLEYYSPISSIEVYDKDDQFVAVLQGKEDRQIISLTEVATPLKQALLATEDREFYSHHGINFGGILRAMFINLTQGKLKQGGSTITQQMVKNIFFPPEEWATIQRKLKEILLSIEVEKKYSKEQILQIYLNQVYWGKSAYGVERASKRYFNKHASGLNVAESAYLVALLTSPSSLHGTPQAIQRQQSIIHNMLKYGYISQNQAQKALNYSLDFQSDPRNLSKFPYYMTFVLQELRKRFSEYELKHAGLKVYTALDPQAQTEAAKILTEGIAKAPTGISQGALVTIDVETNEVRAMIGGTGDFWEHQWNRATSKHTLGSAFKPFVYLTSFIHGGFSGSTLVMDSPYNYQNEQTGEIWQPKNFDGKFWGEISVRKALINSRNIPAIRVAEKTDIHKIVETAESIGLVGVKPYLSSALGSSAASPLSLANAYAVLARGGIYLKPVIIKRVTKGNSLVAQNNLLPDKVLPPKPIYELLDILTGVVDHGTGTRARITGRQVAGKTGTADQARDIWFAGFTPDTVTVLWGGNDQNQQASHYATGGGVMAGIWKEFMTKYYELNPTPVNFFPKPAPRIKLLIDPLSGLLATDDTFQPEYREFVPGTQPTQDAPIPTPEQIKEYLDKLADERQYFVQKDKKLLLLEDPLSFEQPLPYNNGFYADDSSYYNPNRPRRNNLPPRFMKPVLPVPPQSPFSSQEPTSLAPQKFSKERPTNNLQKRSLFNRLKQKFKRKRTKKQDNTNFINPY